ncbi:MAG: hypothetical protein AAGI30_13320 [Planctomycetota bacterium]
MSGASGESTIVGAAVLVAASAAVVLVLFVTLVLLAQALRRGHARHTARKSRSSNSLQTSAWHAAGERVDASAETPDA